MTDRTAELKAELFDSGVGSAILDGWAALLETQASDLVDAETIDDVLAWLKPKERMVVLHDRALLNLAMRLKGAAPDAPKQAAE